MGRRSALVMIPSLIVLTALCLARVTTADDGEVVFNQKCVLCYTPERLRPRHLTKEEWQQILDKMIGFGCPIRTSKKNQQVVLEYLVRTQGPP